MLLKDFYQLIEVLWRPGEAVNFIGNDHIYFTLLDGMKHLHQSGAVDICSRIALIGINLVNLHVFLAGDEGSDF
ncbi:hypothetical protein A2276_04415 [candidate division WOR-1 bacterium RIFOXYA12_FULL_43_27]|uniref:Uncharacterized protein n=1 Tax=candidate division WOR-1 bacterium RIFOXYC2_FULL_46_14 TaxID=1802587 RepID=A0A1F4U498_UNCSA|nr:MAG: hypothetical protein A2276_04415 [candidate division WOR-1 bacterium RIFOXYA12_FULL_43_27]OGC18927.1 MAG: hypothetical protein A2292_08420 [candidate division WOR-1 bacterium RIFOXYB2_FULL_46_45]OGC29068.1 MAG: hypothetical protein A2232_03485 [candidate division WOR-1 bacterium RIFOXYA2_FULL_46_56]OGC39687.1 MAG: hypothetical protein A2438_06875 [candidate division WOR-1 bacterium RIFOXYC2_FULL_46_14]